MADLSLLTILRLPVMHIEQHTRWLPSGLPLRNTMFYEPEGGVSVGCVPGGTEVTDH